MKTKLFLAAVVAVAGTTGCGEDTDGNLNGSAVGVEDINVVVNDNQAEDANLSVKERSLAGEGETTLFQVALSNGNTVAIIDRNTADCGSVYLRESGPGHAASALNGLPAPLRRLNALFEVLTPGTPPPSNVRAAIVRSTEACGEELAELLGAGHALEDVAAAEYDPEASLVEQFFLDDDPRALVEDGNIISTLDHTTCNDYLNRECPPLSGVTLHYCINPTTSPRTRTRNGWTDFWSTMCSNNGSITHRLRRRDYPWGPWGTVGNITQNEDVKDSISQNWWPLLKDWEARGTDNGGGVNFFMSAWTL